MLNQNNEQQPENQAGYNQQQQGPIENPIVTGAAAPTQYPTYDAAMQAYQQQVNDAYNNWVQQSQQAWQDYWGMYQTHWGQGWQNDTNAWDLFWSELEQQKQQVPQVGQWWDNYWQSGRQMTWEWAGTDGHGYWEDPARLYRYKNLIDAGLTPDFVDEAAIKGAWDYLSWKNDGKPYTEWEMPETNDPVAVMLRQMMPPPTQALQEDELLWQFAWGPEGHAYDKQLRALMAGYDADQAVMTRDDYYQQLGYTPVDNWKDLDAWQRWYLTITAPQSTVQGRPDWTRIPASAFYGLLSAGAGATIGGLIGGPIGSTVGGIAAGGATMYSSYTGNEIPVLGQVLEAFDFTERLGKMGVGVPLQVQVAGLDTVLQDLPNAIIASEQVYTTAGVDMVNLVGKPLAWMEAYSRALGDGKTLEEAAQIAKEYSESILAKEGEVWQLGMGYKEAVPVLDAEGNIKTDNLHWGEALNEIRQAMEEPARWGDVAMWLATAATPEDTAWVFADIEEMYGSTGNFNDLIGQFIIDPGEAMSYGSTFVQESVAKNVLGDARLAEAIAQGRGNIAYTLTPFPLNKLLEIGGVQGPNGLVQNVMQYKQWVQEGYYPDGTRPTRGGQEYTPRANELSWLERNLGGLDKEGNIKELAPAREGKNALDRARIYLKELTPDSKAAIGMQNLFETLGVLALQEDGPNMSNQQRAQKLVNMLDTLGQTNPFDVGSAGESLVNSPMFASVQAMYQKALQSGVTKEALTAFIADQARIDLLNQAAAVMGVHPSRLVEDMSKDGEQVYRTFVSMVEKAAADGNQNAQGIMAEIENGTLNQAAFVDELSIFTGKNSKGGDVEKHSWTFEEWRAGLMNQLFDAAEKAMIEHYGVKPDSAFMRFADTLKAAQSMLLLDMNPAYLVNNVINNWVTGVVDGVFGFMTINQADAWMDRFGIRPYRISESGGKAIGLEGAVTEGYTPGQRIMQAMQVDAGVVAMMKKAIQKTRGKMSLMGKLSWMMEEFEGKRTYVTGMRKAWAGMWQEGVGFQKMPAQLEAQLAAIDPNLPKQIYGMLRGAMNGEEINAALFTGQRQVHLEMAIDDAARMLMPNNPEIMREMMATSGVDVKLKDLLGEARTAEDVSRAFRIVQRDMEDYVATELQRNLITRAEESSGKVEQGGIKEALDVLTDLELEMEDYHYNSMMTMAEMHADPETTGAQWRAQFKKDSRAYRRWNDFYITTLAGVLKKWGIADENAQQYLRSVMTIQRGWRDAYDGYDVVSRTNQRATLADVKNPDIQKYHVDGKNDLLRRYFDSADQMTFEARKVAWDTMWEQIQQLFDESWKIELSERHLIDAAFGEMWEQYNGTGAVAKEWRSQVSGVREDMHEAVSKFMRQAKAQKLNRGELKIAKMKFFNETYTPMIQQLQRANLEGARKHTKTLDYLAKKGVQTERVQAEVNTLAGERRRVEAILSEQAVKIEARRIARDAEAAYLGSLDRQAVVDGIKRIYGLKAREMEAVRVLMDLRAEAWAKETGRPAEAWYSETFADFVNEQGLGITPESRTRLNEVNQLKQMVEKGAKGAVNFVGDGRAVMRAMAAKDVSTVVHELGHVFRRQLTDTQTNTVAQWLGVDAQQWALMTDLFDNSDIDGLNQAAAAGTLTEEQGVIYKELQRYVQMEEQFARGFERWLAEGRPEKMAGLPGRIVGVFKSFAQWLLDIYHQVKGSPIDVDLNDGMRQLYGELLGLEREGTGHYSDVNEARLAFQQINKKAQTENQQMWMNGAQEVVKALARDFGQEKVLLPEVIHMPGGEVLPMSIYAEALGMVFDTGEMAYRYEWSKLPISTKLMIAQEYMRSNGWAEIPYSRLGEWVSEGPEALRKRVEAWRESDQRRQAEQARAQVEAEPELEEFMRPQERTLSERIADYEKATEDHPLRRWRKEPMSEANTPAWLREEIQNAAKEFRVYGEKASNYKYDLGEHISNVQYNTYVFAGNRTGTQPKLDAVRAEYMEMFGEEFGKSKYDRMDDSLRAIIDGTEKNNQADQAVKAVLEQVIRGEWMRVEVPNIGKNGKTRMVPMDIGGPSFKYMLELGGEYARAAAIMYFEQMAPYGQVDVEAMLGNDAELIGKFFDALGMVEESDLDIPLMDGEVLSWDQGGEAQAESAALVESEAVVRVTKAGYQVTEVKPFRAGDYIIDQVWMLPAEMGARMGFDGDTDMVWVPRYRADGEAFEESWVSYHQAGTPGMQRVKIVGLMPDAVDMVVVEHADGSLQSINKTMDERRLGLYQEGPKQDSLFQGGEDLPLFSQTAMRAEGEPLANDPQYEAWLQAQKEAGTGQGPQYLEGEQLGLFQMSEPVEQQGNLIAMHNVNSVYLERAINKGGMPGISVGIVNRKNLYSDYGDVTVIFDKTSIDPTNSNNIVKGSDFYSYTYPNIVKRNGKEYFINKDGSYQQATIENVLNHMKSLAETQTEDYFYSPELLKANISERLNTMDEVIYGGNYKYLEESSSELDQAKSLVLRAEDEMFTNISVIEHEFDLEIELEDIYDLILEYHKKKESKTDYQLMENMILDMLNDHDNSNEYSDIDDMVNSVLYFYKELKDSPSPYMEAKLLRIVGVPEIKFVVVPETETSLISLLQENNIPYNTYIGEEERIQAINTGANQHNLLFQQDPAQMMEGKGEVPGSEAMPMAESQAELMRNYLTPMLEATEAQALNQFGQQQMKMDQIDPALQAEFERYLKEGVQGQMAGTKLAAMRKGESMRDASLLNYNRRYGFDKMLELVFPYQFWYTRSMVQWARRAIDKPEWFKLYARLKGFQDREKKRGYPSRLSGKSGFLMPFLPEWAGNMGYYDPMSKLFPMDDLFGGFLQQAGMERSRQTQVAIEYLRGQLDEGQISDEEYRTAIDTKEGYVWETAWATAAAETQGSMTNPGGIVSMMLGKALWVDIPTKIIQGRKDEISPMPFTRTGQALEYAGGDSIIGQAGRMMAAPERALRKKFDMNEFGEWGDYYLDRQLANMAAENPMMTEQVLQAMIERQGPVYEEAYQRVLQEMAYKVPGVMQADAVKAAIRGEANMLDVLGTAYKGLHPTSFVGVGELKLRGLAEEYSDAWKRYSMGEKDAVNKFFENNPEYEARMALFREPEERLRQYLVSNIWEAWAALEGPNKSRIAEQMPGFQDGFLNKETRDYEAFTPQQLANMAATLRQYGNGEPFGLQMGESASLEGLWPAEVDQAVADYWKARDEKWPGMIEIEQRYYASGMPDEMKAYLQPYWDWKAQYRKDNPAVKWHSDQEKMNRIYEEYPKAMADDIVAYLYDEEVRWGQMDIKALQNQYFDLKDQSAGQARTFLGQNPALKAYWDWKRGWRQNSPGVDLYLDRYKVGSQVPNWMGDYEDGETLSQAQIESMGMGLLSALMMYYAGVEMGDGTRQLLRWHWQQQGQPGGSFEQYVDGVLRTSLGY